MQSNISPVEENDCETKWTTKLPPTIKFKPMKERNLNMKEIATSSVFLSKGSMKTISPPLLDNMTELEVFSDASSSVQANVYVDQSLSKSPQGQDLGIQEPALVIPLMPPESKLSSKTLATVEQPGFVRIRLLEGLVVDISIDLDVRLYNPQHRTAVSVSRFGQKVAVIHPTGRACFQPCSIEVQCDDHVSLKKAKIEPGVVSFTGSNLSEVYLLTDMGVTTSLEEIQQNLYVTDHVESQFSAAIKTSFFPSTSSLFSPRTMLDKFRFETTGSGEVRLC